MDNQDLQKNWLIHRVGERVDSFNIDDFKLSIEGLIEKNHLRIGLELQQTKFLSITSIQLLVWWADRLQEKGGRLMLIAPSEKLKRQIAIFGSLDHMMVTKSQDLQWQDQEETPASESPVPDENLGS